MVQLASLNSQKGDFPQSGIARFVEPGADITWDRGRIPIANNFVLTPSIAANSYYFGHPKWAQTYYDACHRTIAFKERWQAVMGDWDGKVVVDIGCGPGNLFATLGGSPQEIIGVDVALVALEMAEKVGYTPLLADAHHLPLISEFADIVTLNATLHHCDDMEAVLAEAARLVRPGGLLVVDHDPQLSAWNYKGLARWLYHIRFWLYHWIFRELDYEATERQYALQTEIHHHPGSGVTVELFEQTLKTLGFTVQLYPHNQAIGAEVLQGELGPFPHWRYPVGQLLSGMNPRSPEAALSLMCIAEKVK
jgi:ubiquinone/menaquinone biosynthesis C-methylase UbiE